jgi:hypothetical protein
MRNILSPCVLILLVMASCRKDSRSSISLTDGPHRAFHLDYPDYFPLKAGNYWIYRQFTIDQDGGLTEGNRIDSCYIEKDTVIRGNTYFILRSPHLFLMQTERPALRDSLHYRIDCRGRIYYSSVDFSTVFGRDTVVDLSTNDTLFFADTRMHHKDSVVTTPAGTFTTINFRETYTVHPDFFIPGSSNPKFSHNIYAKNTGLVYQSFPFSSSEMKMGRRLIRYKLN